MINQLATFHPNGEAACSGCDDALQNIHSVLVAVLLFTFFTLYYLKMNHGCSTVKFGSGVIVAIITD